MSIEVKYMFLIDRIERNLIPILWINPHLSDDQELIYLIIPPLS